MSITWTGFSIFRVFWENKNFSPGKIKKGSILGIWETLEVTFPCLEKIGYAETLKRVIFRNYVDNSRTG